MNGLHVKQLHAFYGKSHVLRGIDLSVAPGEIVAVLGRNGSGRSTLARALVGQLPCSGTVVWNGHALAGRQAFEIAQMGVGYLPESRDIFPNLTVEQNLYLGQKSARKAGRWSLDDMYQLFPRLKERQHTAAGRARVQHQQALQQGGGRDRPQHGALHAQGCSTAADTV